METPRQNVHIEKDEARAGSTPKVMRYVLLFGTALAVVAMSAVWITGALNSPDDTGGAADSTQAVQEGNAASQ